MDSGSKVNAITPAYTAILRLAVGSTNIKAQKIDRFTLLSHGMVMVKFQVENNKKTAFFSRNFLGNKYRNRKSAKNIFSGF